MYVVDPSRRGHCKSHFFLLIFTVTPPGHPFLSFHRTLYIRKNNFDILVYRPDGLKRKTFHLNRYTEGEVVPLFCVSDRVSERGESEPNE